MIDKYLNKFSSCNDCKNYTYCKVHNRICNYVCDDFLHKNINVTKKVLNIIDYLQNDLNKNYELPTPRLMMQSGSEDYSLQIIQDAYNCLRKEKKAYLYTVEQIATLFVHFDRVNVKINKTPVTSKNIHINYKNGSYELSIFFKPQNK